jgi:hypothetical protein
MALVTHTQPRRNGAAPYEPGSARSARSRAEERREARRAGGRLRSKAPSCDHEVALLSLAASAQLYPTSQLPKGD